MIGTIDIDLTAKSPNLPLFPMCAYVSSPSSIRIRNVPKRIGKWNIDNVQFTAAYPDGSIKTAECVLVGGIWTGTIEGTMTSGTSTNGYTIFAGGTDENGETVSGYILGKGDVVILEADGTLNPNAPSYYVHLLSAQSETPKEGDLFPLSGEYYIWQDGETHLLGTPFEQITAYVDSAISSKADLSAIHGEYIEDGTGNKVNANLDCVIGGYTWTIKTSDDMTHVLTSNLPNSFCEDGFYAPVHAEYTDSSWHFEVDYNVDSSYFTIYCHELDLGFEETLQYVLYSPILEGGLPWGPHGESDIILGYAPRNAQRHLATTEWVEGKNYLSSVPDTYNTYADTLSSLSSDGYATETYAVQNLSGVAKIQSMELSDYQAISATADLSTLYVIPEET